MLVYSIDLTAKVGETSGGQSTNHFYERSEENNFSFWFSVMNDLEWQFEEIWKIMNFESFEQDFVFGEDLDLNFDQSK